MISKILQILGIQPQISKVFSRSLEHFFLTVRQNNFGNKIPFLGYCKIFTSLPSFASRCSNCSVVFQRLFLNVFSKDTLKELRKIVYKMSKKHVIDSEEMKVFGIFLHLNY